jgi:hypothetical protein
LSQATDYTDRNKGPCLTVHERKRPVRGKHPKICSILSFSSHKGKFVRELTPIRPSLLKGNVKATTTDYGMTVRNKAFLRHCLSVLYCCILINLSSERASLRYLGLTSCWSAESLVATKETMTFQENNGTYFPQRTVVCA